MQTRATIDSPVAGGEGGRATPLSRYLIFNGQYSRRITIPSPDTIKIRAATPLPASKPSPTSTLQPLWPPIANGSERVAMTAEQEALECLWSAKSRRTNVWVNQIWSHHAKAQTRQEQSRSVRPGLWLYGAELCLRAGTGAAGCDFADPRGVRPRCDVLRHRGDLRTLHERGDC